jgi:hypothetical protein
VEPAGEHAAGGRTGANAAQVDRAGGAGTGAAKTPGDASDAREGKGVRDAKAGKDGKDGQAGNTVALVGFAAPVVGLVEPALTGDGYAVSRVALDADTVRTLVKSRPRVIVLDCHPYVDTRALFGDLRAAPELAEAAVVAVGPPEAPEVSGLEVVRQPGRALELDRLLQAINRAAGKYTG